MEVHTPAHTPDPSTLRQAQGSGHWTRKKFTHYLWEFMMLFLAVFCGFLAENFREHKVENERSGNQSLAHETPQVSKAFSPTLFLRRSLLRVFAPSLFILNCRI